MDNQSPTLRDLQLCELQILKAVIHLCEAHDIPYFLIGGTFLGAVRHGGFIPWDDDIDVGLRRDDYQRLLDVAARELPAPYTLRFFATDATVEDYPAKVEDPTFRIRDTSAQVEKVRCAWIDLFPMDGVPNNPIAFQCYKFHLLYLRMMLKYSQFSTVVRTQLRHRPLHERILISLGKVLKLEDRLDTGEYLQKIDRALRKHPYAGSRRTVNFMGAYKFREMFPRSLFDALSLYPFEDLMLPAPRDYDAVLRHMYGDYMTPPAKEDQNKHGVEAMSQDPEEKST